MLYSIQLCRALAALLVVFFHSAGNLAKEKYFGSAAAPLERIFWFGGEAGVAFFFVLSGFIIHHIHRQDFDQPEKLTAYLRKRAVRIYPTYLLIFSAVYLAAKSVPSLQNTVPSDPMVLLKSLVLLPQDSEVVGGTGAPVLIVAWSLQYEMVFYAIFALALARRWLFYAVATMLVLNLLIEPFSGSYEFPRNFFASPLILLFGMGMLASSAVKSKISLKHAGWSAVISSLAFAMIALIATHNRATHQKSIVELAYGVASAALIFSLARFEGQRGHEFEARYSTMLGDASYALYLIHFPLVAILSKIAIFALPVNAFGVGAAFLLLVGGSVAAALAFNLIIERPILRRLTPAGVSPVRAR